MDTTENETELRNADTTSEPNVHHESNAHKICILIAISLLQLPIWGFAMSYGVFQDYYTSTAILQGSRAATGAVGTTANGVIYLSMPFLFTAFSQRWAHWRTTVTICGVVLMCLSFLASSYSTKVSQIVATQGVLAALGCALVYSPITLSLGETFTTGNRAFVYGIVLSSKNIVGSSCPFLFRGLLDRCGFRTTMQVWTGIVAGSSLISLCLILAADRSSTHTEARPTRSRHTPWEFLKHQTFYIYSIAVMLQSCGYGIPQTYLNSYAHDEASLSQTSATLLLTLFNIPGILSSSFFGYISDNKHFSLSANTVTCISALPAALAVFFLWGFAPRSSLWGLALFSIIFGFFSSGYSATWGGVLKQMESEARERNEAVDTGVLYGLLNGARGLGYVSGGVMSVKLLGNGAPKLAGPSGYGTEYGPLIIFTGLTSVFGGWSLMWKCTSARR